MAEEIYGIRKNKCLKKVNQMAVVEGKTTVSGSKNSAVVTLPDGFNPINSYLVSLAIKNLSGSAWTYTTNYTISGSTNRTLDMRLDGYTGVLNYRALFVCVE